jgi:hypothetical protein
MATSDSSNPEEKRAAAPKSGSTVAKKASGATRPVTRRVDEEEETQVVGGRFLVAALIMGALTVIPMSALGNLFEPAEPPPTDTSSWVPGSKGMIRLTVVTADAASLTCASTQSFEGRHCAYKSESEVWPRDPEQPLDDNKALTIQPYRTWLDNKLILVSGVWSFPFTAYRLHQEPPGNLPSDKLARYVIECQVHFGGKMDKPALRWQPGQSWGNEQPTMVAIADDCKTIEEPSADCPSGPICALFNAISPTKKK